jgi:hypothetical protein
MGLLSCGGDGPGTTEPDPPRATTVTLSQSAITMTFLGEVSFLSAQVQDQFQKAFSAPVAWASDNPAVAAVTATGQVTAVGNGATSIRATAGGVSAAASVTVTQKATRVEVVSGNLQTATVGQALAQPLVARAVDQGGAPMPGASVTFTVTSGNGSVQASSTTTDAQAQVAATWTLGTTAGPQKLAAAITGITAGAAVFDATATAAPPASLNKTVGDGGVGTVGFALDLQPTVKLVDAFGNGVPGVPISFAVTGGGGSVAPAQANSGSDGTAKTTWTLGAALGQNTLSATAPGIAPVTFTANAEAAKADLVPGPLVTKPANPTVLDSVRVTATVTNSGRLATGGGFEVSLLVDGTVAGTVTLPTLPIGGQADATFELAPMTAGTHVLRVLVDAPGAVVETNDANNSLESTRTVVGAQKLTPGTPVTGLSGALESERVFTLEVPASSPGTMVVSLSGGTGDVDMYVNYGDRPAHRDDYECQSGNPDTTERCVFNGAEPGTYYILLYAFSEFSGADLVATTGGPVIPYDIELVFINHGTPAQDSAFIEAAAIWSRIITSDINDVNFAADPVAANECHDGQPRVDDVVDDLRIFVDIVDIDGPGGTLARAGPCLVRGLSELAILGTMEFDSGDMATLTSQGGLLPVVLHEMGHVLGFGTVWDRLDLLREPSLPSNQGADTHFAGPRAIAAFDAAGGGSVYTLGAKVPVENVAREGSGDSHWRETVLGEEIMTPFYNGGRNNPLSAITIQSLGDLGYKVDVSRAEPFSKSYRAPAPGQDPDVLIDLSDDARRGPIKVRELKGRIR